MGTLEYGMDTDYKVDKLSDTDYKVDKLSDTDCKVDKLSNSYTHMGWHAHLLN